MTDEDFTVSCVGAGRADDGTTSSSLRYLYHLRLSVTKNICPEIDKAYSSDCPLCPFSVSFFIRNQNNTDTK